jgi:hypothetical protein
MLQVLSFPFLGQVPDDFDQLTVNEKADVIASLPEDQRPEAIARVPGNQITPLLDRLIELDVFTREQVTLLKTRILTHGAQTRESERDLTLALLNGGASTVNDMFHHFNKQKPSTANNVIFGAVSGFASFKFFKLVATPATSGTSKVVLGILGTLFTLDAIEKLAKAAGARKLPQISPKSAIIGVK